MPSLIICPRIHQEEEGMNSEWGLRLFWGDREFQIVNDSSFTIYVSLEEPQPSVTGVDKGRCAIYPMTHDTARVTLSYYTQKPERMMKEVCSKLLVNKGRRLRVMDSSRPHS